MSHHKAPDRCEIGQRCMEGGHELEVFRKMYDCFNMKSLGMMKLVRVTRR